MAPSMPHIFEKLLQCHWHQPVFLYREVGVSKETTTQRENQQSTVCSEHFMQYDVIETMIQC